MKTLLTTSVLVLLVGVWGSPVLGTVVFEDGFENAVSVPGDAAGTPVVGDSWELYHRGDSRTRISLSAAANTGSKAMLMQRIDYPDTCWAKGHLSAASTALVDTNGNATFSFAINKSSSGDSRASEGIGFYNDTTKGMSLSFNADGSVTYWDGSSMQDTGLTYAVDTYQDVTVYLDFDAHTFTVEVEGTTTGNSTDIPFLNNVDTMTAVEFSVGKTAVVRIDDVLVTTIPEPATIGLLLLGVGFLRRKW